MNETLWGVVNTLVRISAILLLMRIFGINRIFRWIARSLLVVSILYGVVVFLEVFLICRPMAVDWNASVDGKCGNQILAYLVLEVFGLLLDFTILVLPIPVVWGLKMKWKTKIYSTIIFSIGVLSVLPDPRFSMDIDWQIEFSSSLGYDSRLLIWSMPKISPTQKVTLVYSLQ